MLMALDNHGILIHISQAVIKNQYYCPDCHQELVIRHREDGRNFFAHSDREPKQSGETSEHLTGKQQIYEWARRRGWNPQLEVSLPRIDQRADVMLSINGQRVAIEFQCSPLTLRQIRERNLGYASEGILVKWLLGHRYQRKLGSQKIAQFTQFHRQLGLPFWNVTQNTLNYKCNYYQYSFGTASRSRAEIIRHQTLRLHRMRNLSRELMNMAYQNGHIASCCPLFTHDLKKRWPVMCRPILEWRIQTLIALERLPLGTFMTNSTWQTWLFQQADWLMFPCLSGQWVTDLRQQTINDWHQTLINNGIIQQLMSGIRYSKPPRWFSNIDQKLIMIK